MAYCGIQGPCGRVAMGYADLERRTQRRAVPHPPAVFACGVILHAPLKTAQSPLLLGCRRVLGAWESCEIMRIYAVLESRRG